MSCDTYTYAVLAIISNSYPPRKGRLLMYYSPVRHSPPKWCVRLACIRHAASVHPEPGSNSPLSYVKTLNVFLTLINCFSLFRYLETFFLLTCFCLVFNVLLVTLAECSYNISFPFSFVKSFFIFFYLFLLFFIHFFLIYLKKSLVFFVF